MASSAADDLPPPVRSPCLLSFCAGWAVTRIGVADARRRNALDHPFIPSAHRLIWRICSLQQIGHIAGTPTGGSGSQHPTRSARTAREFPTSFPERGPISCGEDCPRRLDRRGALGSLLGLRECLELHQARVLSLRLPQFLRSRRSGIIIAPRVHCVGTHFGDFVASREVITRAGPFGALFW